jgi:hypothetical protein
LRWLWWRITALGEIACILGSSVLAPWLVAALPDEQEALRLLLVALGATLLGVSVSLLDKSPDPTRVQVFYAQARPPGFWGPQAAALGEPATEARARLGRGLLRTFLAALGLFCALVGLGTWLVSGSAPSWFPLESLWVPALLLCSLALTLSGRRTQAG